MDSSFLLWCWHVAFATLLFYVNPVGMFDASISPYREFNWSTTAILPLVMSFNRAAFPEINSSINCCTDWSMRLCGTTGMLEGPTNFTPESLRLTCSSTQRSGLTLCDTWPTIWYLTWRRLQSSETSMFLLLRHGTAFVPGIESWYIIIRVCTVY